MLNSQGQNRQSYTHEFNSGGNINETINPDGSLTIYYSVPRLTLQSVKNENGTFYRIAIPEHIQSTEAGMPELPVFSKLLSVPENSKITIRISEVKSSGLNPGRKMAGLLYPAQESEIKAVQDDRKIFRMDKATYKKRTLLESDTVNIVYEGISRNRTLANIYIRPVRYNPGKNTIEVITSMKIDVAFTGNAPKTVKQESVLFSESVSKGVINPDLIRDFSTGPAGMIILTDTMFRKQLAPFIRWKTQKGFRMQVLFKGTGLAGNNYSELKDTLKKIYLAATDEIPAPEYLMIIGDVNKVPNSQAASGNITDLYYGEFDGNGDYLPEMYIGRIPASDTSELSSVLKKIIQYEKFEFADTNSFYNNALATTGYDVAHKQYMNGQVHYQVTNYLTPMNYITGKYFYHTSETDPVKVLTILEAQKKNIIDSMINIGGLSFINYSGHGSASGWLNLSILASDVTRFENRNMYPFIISNACLTGQFDKSTSFGNRMVLEKQKGAVTFIGCSNDSYWDEDYFWAIGAGPISENPAYNNKGQGIFDRLFHTHGEVPGEWSYTAGQINYAGNLSVSASTSTRKKYYWETYNIIGDPSLIPILGKPRKFNISLPDTLPNGIKTLMLNADPFSYIAVSHSDTLWDATFAGSSGSATLNLPDISNDSCLVVITGQNRYPVIKTIFFSDLKGEFLNLESYSVNDKEGNNDGQPDYGERFCLDLVLKNLGNSAADNISIGLTPGSEWLNIEKDTVNVKRIEPGSSGIITYSLMMRVVGNVPDLEIAPVSIKITCNATEKIIPVELLLHSPVLSIPTFTINDDKTGNGDFIADPGETLDLAFIIRNEGTSDASGDFSLSSANPAIDIDNPSVKSGILKHSETTFIPVRVKLSPDLMSGDYISLYSSLLCPPFNIEKSFTLRIGKVRESFEAGSFKLFPWLNNSQVPWIITGDNSYDGIKAAKSGKIGSMGSTTLSIKIYYPANDTLKFRYKVSSEPDFDVFSFRINGKEILKKKSGEVPWTTIQVPVQPGLNDLVWSYNKDGSVTQGSDCAWLDLIDFTASGSVKYIRRDLKLERIIEPIDINQVGRGDLSVKVANSGSDTIKSFNLAYTINNSSPVSQQFKWRLSPGEDTTVTFTNKMDLSRSGVYYVKVFGVGNNDDYLRNDTTSLMIENTDVNESLGIYPNPFNTDFRIYINSHSEDLVTISILNVNGSLFYQSEKNIITGGNTILFTGLNLKPGMYYIRIKGKRINKTVPLIKIRD
ncbi:MAG TPA: C25 family cysteine peptidase [Bacteroidales bacterium]|nr:C25 family cysteine peptidase [Bacteroidales bacterium]